MHGKRTTPKRHPLGGERRWNDVGSLLLRFSRYQTLFNQTCSDFRNSPPQSNARERAVHRIRLACYRQSSGRGNQGGQSRISRTTTNPSKRAAISTSTPLL